MGISLFGLTPAATYPSLIKFGDNSAISGTLRALSDGLGTDLPIQVSTAGVNFTGTASIGGTALSPSSGVSGAIQFSNGSAFASDATNFFWDNTNKRLGVGTNAPTGRTQITESFTTTGNNYSAITFDGILTSRATASDTIFGFRNTQSIVSTAAGQTIIANDLTPNYTFFDGNTDAIGLRIGGLKNTQNNGTAILMQQTATAGNNGLAIQPANSRWQIGYCNGQSTQIANARVVYGPSGIRIATSSAPASNLFEIIGTGSTSATTSLLVQNSAGASSLSVKDDGYVTAHVGLFSLGALTGVNVAASNILYNAKFWNQSDGGTTIGAQAAPAASSILDIRSTTSGVLFPRMTTTQRTAITGTAGLMVYDNTVNKLFVHNGTVWEQIQSI